MKYSVKLLTLAAALVFTGVAQAGTVFWIGWDSTATNDSAFNNNYGWAWSKGWAWGSYKNNNQGQDIFHPNWNVWVDNGTLKVKGYTDGSGNMYGGALTTGYNKKTIKYGILEARVKSEYQYGYCPAFWMIPTDGSWPPEIDIFEFPGAKSDSGKKLHFTTHWKKSGGGNGAFGVEIYKGGGQKWTGSWHTYMMKWFSNRVELFIDNQYKTAIWDAGSDNRAPDKDMYAVLSVEVSLGGNGWSGWPGWNTSCTMEVDHVWLYQN